MGAITRRRLIHQFEVADLSESALLYVQSEYLVAMWTVAFKVVREPRRF